MNRQFTLRLFGIILAGVPLALLSNAYYERKAAAIAADPRAWLAHQTATVNSGFLTHYIAWVCVAAGICVFVELIARVADWILPSPRGD
jgi:uncharacterized oligopeptide transporter (OPT) family protein